VSGSIRCNVVSPERPLFEGSVDHLVAPGVEGELGVYPRHAPLIGALGPGLVRLHQGAHVERFAIRGGFILVKKDVVTLLVTDAVKPADVDRAKVEAERESVVEALKHPRSEGEYEELMRQRRWCDVRLAMFEKRPALAH
jgi:F-type H+-transporting ATPase subunit epsilon